MPKIKPRRKLTKAQKRAKKKVKLSQIKAVKRQTERFLAQFSPEVQEHLKGEFFKKIEERRALRRQQATPEIAPRGLLRYLLVDDQAVVV